MDWLRENWFFLLVIVLFAVIHMGHGHGGHAGHARRESKRDDTQTDGGRHAQD